MASRRGCISGDNMKRFNAPLAAPFTASALAAGCRVWVVGGTLPDNDVSGNPIHVSDLGQVLTHLVSRAG